MGTSTDQHNGIQIAVTTALNLSSAKRLIEKILEKFEQSPFFQQRAETLAIHAQGRGCCQIWTAGQFRQLLVVADRCAGQPAFEPFGRIKKRGQPTLTRWKSLRLKIIQKPSIEISPPQSDASFAENTGLAEGLATLSEVSALESQQLSQGCGPTFASFQSDKGQIERAATEVNDQQFRSRRQPSAQGRSGWFIHQGDFRNLQGRASVEQPLAIKSIAFHRCSEHKALNGQIPGNPRPDFLKQASPCLIRTEPLPPLRGHRLADQALEVPVELRCIAVAKTALNHLASHQRIA